MQKTKRIWGLTYHRAGRAGPRPSVEFRAKALRGVGYRVEIVSGDVGWYIFTYPKFRMKDWND